MNWVSRTLSSSVGCKVVMAVTGLALVGFLVGHLAGNLLVFGGPDAINGYAKGLRNFTPLLWIMRIGILAAFAAHIFSGIRLTALNQKARPVPYKVKKNVRASFCSRYMGLSGLVVLGFVLYHLAHLTLKVTHPQFAELDQFDVYQMLLISFKNPLLAGLYTVSVVLLMIHLNHGVSSLFQTLGFHHRKYQKLITLLGPSLSAILGLGFVSVPLAIFLGLIQ